MVPLAAVPPMLDGHAEVAGQAGTSFVAEIVLARVRLIANALPSGAVPGCTWGERPVAWLTDLLLTLATAADPRLRAVLPPAPA